MFCALNGRNLYARVDDAVDQMLAVAAGELTEGEMAVWISGRLGPAD